MKYAIGTMIGAGIAYYFGLKNISGFLFLAACFMAMAFKKE